jgi:hypothetical protein
MMNLSEYIEYDAIGLAQLITNGQVTANEVQQVARRAIESVNPELNALVGDLFDEPLPYSADGLSPAFRLPSRTWYCMRKGCQRGWGVAWQVRAFPSPTTQIL